MAVFVCTNPECGVLWSDTKMLKNPSKTSLRKRCPDCELDNRNHTPPKKKRVETKARRK